MTRHQTHNDDTGSLFTGPVRLSVGDAVAIEDEGIVRHVTFVMGSDRNGWRACFAGQGAVPRGKVGWRVGAAGADRPRVLRPSPRAARRADPWASIPLPSSVRAPRSVLVTGFDSAWTTTNRGAITSCLIGPRGVRALVPPRAASFAEAAEIIEGAEARAKHPWLHVVVVDQPLIVPNEHGTRPVERALAPIFGRFAGGVQPANRSRLAMFGDDAPIWQFLARMSGSTSPWHRGGGRVVIESFPALAVLGLFPRVYESGALPKYNPERRRTFSIEDWRALCRSLAGVLGTLQMSSVADWCAEAAERMPRKADQDALDSVLCMLVGILWWAAPSTVLVAGDLQHGYVVAPSHAALEEELRSAGLVPGVPVARGPGPLTPVAPVGSPAAVLAAVRGTHAASARDVDALSRRIAAGRKPARYEPPVR